MSYEKAEFQRSFERSPFFKKLGKTKVRGKKEELPPPAQDKTETLFNHVDNGNNTITMPKKDFESMKSRYETAEANTSLHNVFLYKEAFYFGGKTMKSGFAPAKVYKKINVTDNGDNTVTMLKEDFEYIKNLGAQEKKPEGNSHRIAVRF